MIDPDDFDVFAKAYLAAMLWLSDDKEDFDAISQELLESILQDCTNFQKDNADLLELAYNYSNYNEGQAGHDFYLTRCGHGAGFWDRGLEEVGTKLTDASHIYGDVDCYVGDDKLLY